VRVPINYGPKEKYLSRLRQDPNLSRQVEVVLPQLSYDQPSMNYDPQRALQMTNKMANVGGASDHLLSMFTGAPWDLSFTLSLFARNIDDAYQVIEQIIPFFRQDYTLSINVMPEMGEAGKKNFPLILQGMDTNIEYEGPYETIRMIQWDLNFIMKATYYGPVANTPLITTVTTTMYNAYGLFDEFVDLEFYANTGTGSFKTGEIVYQGRTLNESYVQGEVAEWNANLGHLRLANVSSGHFLSNVVIKSAESNASGYIVFTAEEVPTPMSRIVVTPDPANANANSSYGYHTTITEYPQL